MLGLGLGLDGLDGGSFAAILAGAYANVVAAVAKDNSLIIRDTVTPANNYNGPLITGGVFNKFTYTNASANRTFIGSNGLIQYAGVNVPRIEYDPVTLAVKGYLHEGARTNTALWSRDMTNAVWVKTTMTAALTATGADGAASSATTLTATAGNATVLQTITLASATDVYSVRLRRRTGSGTIQIAQDGVTWNTVALTASFQRFNITAGTLVNPIIGIRIVTNGDAIDADFNQLETGAKPSSDIATTTVAVTRAADNGPFLANTLCNMAALEPTSTIYAKYLPYSTGAGEGVYYLGDAALNNRRDLRGDGSTVASAGGVVILNGFASGTPNLGVFNKHAASLQNNSWKASLNGAIVTSAPTPMPTGFTAFGLGTLTSNGGQPGFVSIQEFLLTPTILSSAALQALTQ